MLFYFGTRQVLLLGMLLVGILYHMASAEINQLAVAVNHFDSKNNSTFNLRYSYSMEYMDPTSCILFFLLGGEGAANLGVTAPFVTQNLASYFRAGVIHAEHRYYGQSLRPEFKDNLKYLTIEQALRDYSDLILHIQSTMQSSCKVIAVGGSYPGNLAILFRLLYPHLVFAAYASSAPIRYLTGETVPTEYFEIVERTARSANAKCPSRIRQILNSILQLNVSEVVTQLRLCRHTLPAPSEDLKAQLVQAVRVTFANLNMGSYPLHASKLSEICASVVDSEGSYDALFDEVFNAVNESDGRSCRDFGRIVPTGGKGVFCADTTGCGAGLDGEHWDWQACTEHVMSIGSPDGMFPPLEGASRRIADYCMDRFRVTPRSPSPLVRYYLGRVHNLPSVTSRILFVNGRNDGWTSGCLRNSLSDSLVVLEIPGGAHHSEFGAEAAGDDVHMQGARRAIRDTISAFLRHDSEPA